MNRKRFEQYKWKFFPSLLSLRFISRMEIKFYTINFPSVNCERTRAMWRAAKEGKYFLFMFLINFFHSVSFFTSHLIKHISLAHSCSFLLTPSLPHRSKFSFLPLLFIASTTLRNKFSLIFLRSMFSVLIRKFLASIFEVSLRLARHEFMYFYCGKICYHIIQCLITVI